MKVRIPTPLRSYTDQQKVVEASGGSVAAVLDDLDRQFPGLRFRVVDEQGRVRTHMKVFINQDAVRDLGAIVDPRDEVTISKPCPVGSCRHSP